MTTRDDLSQFPCSLDFMDGVWGGASCESSARETCAVASVCALLPIYEQAIADRRCARALLALKRWWWDRHYWAGIFTGESGDPGAVRVARLRKLMEGRLRAAGLE